MLKCVNIWNDINRRSSQQITSSQAWICNPKMLGFRLSWLQKESYIVKLKHLYTWTINYCTYRFRASTPCVLGIWRHLPFQSCQRWLLWCIRVCAVCNIVHDLFNEINYFSLHIVSTLACVYLKLSTWTKQAANLVFLFTFPLCETFLRNLKRNVTFFTTSVTVQVKGSRLNVSVVVFEDVTQYYVTPSWFLRMRL